MAMKLFNKGRKKEKEIKDQEIRMGDILRTIVRQEIKEAAEEHQARLSSEYSELSERLQKRLAKHNAILEDILETVEDNKQDKQNLENALSSEKKQKDSLLDLLLLYQEYLDLIESHINGKNENKEDKENNEKNENNANKENIEKEEAYHSNWKAQLDLVYSELEHGMSLCGIEKISAKDVKVNTALHQVIDTVVTEDPRRGETVQTVLVPGYIYHGKVVRKAKIIARIYEGEENV